MYASHCTPADCSILCTEQFSCTVVVNRDIHMWAIVLLMIVVYCVYWLTTHALSLTQGTALPEAPDFNEARESLQVDKTVPELDWLQPGSAAAHAALDDFIQNRLKLFDTSRNDPNVEACSGLSPYFHFGQVVSFCLRYRALSFCCVKYVRRCWL